MPVVHHNLSTILWKIPYKQDISITQAGVSITEPTAYHQSKLHQHIQCCFLVTFGFQASSRNSLWQKKAVLWFSWFGHLTQLTGGRPDMKRPYLKSSHLSVVRGISETAKRGYEKDQLDLKSNQVGVLRGISETVKKRIWKGPATFKVQSPKCVKESVKQLKGVSSPLTLTQTHCARDSAARWVPHRDFQCEALALAIKCSLGQQG